jgi:methyl-accepting chemotaxis protein
MNDVVTAALGALVGAGAAAAVWPRLWPGRRPSGAVEEAQPLPPADLQALKAALGAAQTGVEALRRLEIPVLTAAPQAPAKAPAGAPAPPSGEAVVAQILRLHELIDQLDGFTSHALASNENLRNTLTQVSAASNLVDARLGAVAPLFNEAALLSTTVTDHLQALHDTNKTAGARAAAAHSEWQGCYGLLEDFTVALEQMQASVAQVQDLANKSKLLSLNAAIVASQSQENGHGFSVVADQIKAMAHRALDVAHAIQGGVDAVHQVRQQVEVLASQQAHTLEAGRGAFTTAQQQALVAITTHASLRHLLEQRAQAASQEDTAVSALKEATATLIGELMDLNGALRIQGKDTRRAQALVARLQQAAQAWAAATGQPAPANGQPDAAVQLAMLWLERHRQEAAALNNLGAALAQAHSAAHKLGLPYDQVDTMAASS